MKAELRGPPKIVHAAGHSFSDVAAKCVHIVNLASVRELERTLGRPVDPLRFRANLYLEGVAPWAEFGWIGKEIAVGDVQARRVRAHDALRGDQRRSGDGACATWPSRPTCSGPGATRTSASTPRS